MENIASTESYPSQPIKLNISQDKISSEKPSGQKDQTDTKDQKTPSQKADFLRASEVIHDLKNKVGGAVMFSQLLQMDLSANQTKTIIQTIQTNSTQLEKLIQNYLTAAKNRYQNILLSTDQSAGEQLMFSQTKNIIAGVKDYATKTKTAMTTLLAHPSYHQEGSQYVGTINELIAKIETGLKNLEMTIKHEKQQEKTVVELNSFLKDALPILQLYKSRYPYVQLIIHKSRRPLYIKTNKEELLDSIYNLIMNAAYAMRYSDGFITINLDEKMIKKNSQENPAGDYIGISVADQGLGMDNETKKQLFQPFTSTKKPCEGTGLGLVSVNHFVKDSDGFVEVASEIRQGTTITLNIPQLKSDQL